MGPTTTPGDVRALAFYLPQFHPIPENDAWWGPGFTDWHNVVQARPAFPGHEQPNLPADLGFYDLRLPETRELQAAVARAHGIAGFVYHEYWLGGRRLLDRPFREVLRSGRPDFPFALCWANENWDRSWGAHQDELLAVQSYGEEERARHAAELAEAFADSRYLRFDGRPLLLIYRVESLPRPAARYVEALKAECIREGAAEPYVVQVESGGTRRPPAENGCDAEAEFPPHRLDRVAPPRRGARTGGNLVYDYEEVVERNLGRETPPWCRHSGVTPRWDNTPRRPQGQRVILDGSTPAAYERWLRNAVGTEAARGQGLIFVNAWNEWAEGAYLEPDQRHGTAYLEASRAVLGTSEPAPQAPDPGNDLPTPDLASAYVELHARYVDLQRAYHDAFRRGWETARQEHSVRRMLTEAYDRLMSELQRLRAPR